MKMIVLNGVLHQPKVTALTRPHKGSPHFLHQRSIPKIENSLHYPQRNMGGRESMKSSSPTMWFLPSPDLLAPSPFARPAMPSRHAFPNNVFGELELFDYRHTETLAQP
jgi:hypothetical protein